MHSLDDRKKEKKSPAQVLRAAGVRPTSQRLALASFLFDGAHKHMTAEQIFEAISGGKNGAKAPKATQPVNPMNAATATPNAATKTTGISLATVYNNLHHFTAAGLLRELSVDSRRSFYDTNITAHGHVFDPETGCLVDLPPETLPLPPLPAALQGRTVARMDVMLWLAPRNQETLSSK